MIGHVQQARFFPFVVVADEVEIGVGGHIGSGYLDVFISGDINTCRVIVLIIFPGGYWKGGDRALPVIHDSVNVWWENGEGIVIHRNSRVCPP